MNDKRISSLTSLSTRNPEFNKRTIMTINPQKIKVDAKDLSAESVDVTDILLQNVVNSKEDKE
jgi:hypothetical protein